MSTALDDVERPAPPRRRWVRWRAFAAWQTIALGLATVQVRALWAWFAVPLGAPSLGWAHTVGLILLVASLSPSPRPGETRVTYGQELTARWWRFAQRMGIGLVVHWIASGHVGW